MVSLTGNWNGKTSGTNNADIAIDIAEVDSKLSGTIRINDLRHGVSVYDYEGHRDGSTIQFKGAPRPEYRRSQNVTVNGRPVVIDNSVRHGEISAEGRIEHDDRITGSWRSSIGTGGTFSIERARHQNAPFRANKIFIIHGRDEGPKDMVARFLEHLGLEPVILAERPSQGRTIIEKFEQHAQVGFAIALLTPEDAGSLQGNEDNLNPRARQNVIFELGFFIGRIGRERVCALTKGGVEIPSDYSGVVYIPFDDFGGWKEKLVQELLTAGVPTKRNETSTF